MSVPGLSWACEVVNGNVWLNEHFQKETIIEGLKTTLYPHQQTVVRAMRQAETATFGANGVVEKINAAYLSEPVGSGKTIDLLSLILLQPMPPIRPDINVMNDLVGGVMRIKYCKILTPTLILVGNNVLCQWSRAIRTFTNLKVFVVKNVFHLQSLIDMMASRIINRYDIVLVKNGKITKPIKFPKDVRVEDKNKYFTTFHIINILENMRCYCWARVVLDDYDVCNIPTTFGHLNGLFTWYVSSTNVLRKGRCAVDKCETTADALMLKFRRRAPNKKYIIRNEPGFIKQTTRIPSIEFMKYEFENPNNNYIDLIRMFNNPTADDISEMINNDAIKTASETLGIKTNSVSAIFEHMLGKKYDEFKLSSEILEFIAEQKENSHTWLPMSANENKEDTYNQKHVIEKRPIEYKYPGINKLLDTMVENHTSRKNEASVAIERVKSNIKDGECPVCLTDLEDFDEDVFILKCCGTTICGYCCMNNILSTRTKSCVKCRKYVNPETSLIYLAQEFDLSKIVQDDVDYVHVEDNVEEKEVVATKISTLIDIIHGKAQGTKVDVSMGNLMKGTHTFSEAKTKKVLVFANYDESLNKITSELKSKKIKYWRLMGKANSIDQMVEEFRQCQEPCVLVINSIKYCAGLNLQCSTDLVFTHQIINFGTETQVMGRSQRLGRDSNLKVHYLLYKNEFDNMVRENRIRLI